MTDSLAVELIREAQGISNALWGIMFVLIGIMVELIGIAIGTGGKDD